MKTILALAVIFTLSASHAQQGRSSLPTEPGAIDLENLLPKPLYLAVKQDTSIFYTIGMDRVLGSMAKATQVKLVGMSDTAYRVRGRARHADVSGWMKRDDLVLPDPTLPDKLKALYERQKLVSDLITAHQVGIGMSKSEVQQSLGKPTRTTAKVTAAGREDKLEYAVFEKVPQTTVGRAPNGQLVQTVIYVKIEVGTLSISFKNNIVDTIEETKGNPLHGGGVQIVPLPITVF